MKNYVFLLVIIGIINISISIMYFSDSSHNIPDAPFDSGPNRSYYIVTQRTNSIMKYNLITGMLLITIAACLAARYKTDK
jgi:hypothetical protein